jgi:hypothetical protein
MRWTGHLALVGIIAASVPAQLATTHQAGLVVPADIDRDAHDDFFVYDGRAFHAWRGTNVDPFVQQLGSHAVAFNRRMSSPVVAGRYLFVPLVGDLFTPVGGIEVFEILVDGSLSLVRSFRLDPLQSGGTVHCVRLSVLSRDLGGDGVPDVLVAWTEFPRPANGAFRIARMNWNQLDAPFTVDLVDGPAEPFRISGLFPTQNLAQPADEVLMVVSAAPSQGTHRFGFVTMSVQDSDIRIVGSRWHQYAPTVRQGGWGDAWGAVAYGRFSPTPVLATPVVTFLPGPTIVFHPELSDPFVSPHGGAWIDTTRRGYLLEDAVADFDGDGADELLIVQPGLGSMGDVIAVTDPHPMGRSYQVFSYREYGFRRGLPPDPAVDSSVFHGANLDVDADGRQDVVVTIQVGNQGALSLLRGRVTGRGGRTGLVRVY